MNPRPPCGACGLFEGHDKPEDCDLHPSHELPPVLELTPRQVRLLWEALTTVDEDVLSTNCIKIGIEPPSGHEITQLMDVLDPEEQFLTEWMRRDEDKDKE